VIAADIVAMHPEYHALLETGEAALAREWTPEDGETNPFLHLSLHLAIEEQLSIDQPPGIRAAFDQRARAMAIATRRCMIFSTASVRRSGGASRDRAPLDAGAYLECIRRKP